MKRVIGLIVSLSVLIMLGSCTSGTEARGNKAYAKAQKAQGGDKRVLEKTAYMMYKAAIKAKPDKITPQLRSRFLEIALNRASMVLEEGTLDMDALPLILEEVDGLWNGELPEQIKNSYTDLMFRMADSSKARGKLLDAVSYLDKAVNVAANQSQAQQRRSESMQQLIVESLEQAKFHQQDGVEQKSAESLLRAEYYAKLAMVLDSTNADAAALLSALRRLNLGTYSAYVSVIEEMADTLLFRKVNNYDILLAIPSMTPRGGATTMQVMMYNYSYNPLRLRAADFYLEDVNGTRYSAQSSSKLEPEILDQERETTLQLVFNTSGATIRKLGYLNGDHKSDKYFF
jgi:hypothetical protein